MNSSNILIISKSLINIDISINLSVHVVLVLLLATLSMILVITSEVLLVTVISCCTFSFILFSIVFEVLSIIFLLIISSISIGIIFSRDSLPGCHHFFNIIFVFSVKWSTWFCHFFLHSNDFFNQNVIVTNTSNVRMWY